MVSRLIIAMALAASLTGCINYQTYLPGTEAKAISMCAPNGGVKRIQIYTNGLEPGPYRTHARVECKTDGMVAEVYADSSASDTVVQFESY